jgi:hypothetical protein
MTAGAGRDFYPDAVPSGDAVSDGARVVIHSDDYQGTSAARRAELQAIVDSIKIEP